MSQKDLLTVTEAAALAGIGESTWTSYVSRGRAPEADGPRDASTSWRPRWHRTTVEHWRDNRDGQGKRTDLIRARHDQQQRMDAERTAATPASPPGLREWLAQHHRALLDVADVLVDHRDALLELSTEPEILAEAIDAAGMAMDRTPRKSLASAVTQALSVIQRTVRGADPELAGWLGHRWWLHEQFQPWAGQGD